jgi:hypothetical protein
VIQETAKGKHVKFTMNVQAEILGKQVEFKTRNTATYDDTGRALAFSAVHERMGETITVRGQRAKGGFDITRTEGGETEEIRVEPGTFELVSIEPSLASGDVGSKKKARILYTASGKVRKATIRILDRATKLVLGKERTVTHFTVKGSLGTLEEWRTDDGLTLKSRIKTPMGKLLVKLTSPLP